MVSTKIQYITEKTVFRHYISKLDLESFLGFEREWDQYQDITHLTFSLDPYSLGKIQEQAIQWYLPQRLSMKLLGRKSHTNHTDL